MIKRHWKPEPVQSPVVDKDFPNLSGVERAAEVMRFMLIKLEHWLSPKGTLRQFIKINLRFAVILAVPILLVAPLITMALVMFKSWIVLLTQTFSSFILFPLSVILSILLVCGTFYIGRAIMDMRVKARRDDHKDNYY